MCSLHENGIYVDKEHAVHAVPDTARLSLSYLKGKTTFLIEYNFCIAGLVLLLAASLDLKTIEAMIVSKHQNFFRPKKGVPLRLQMQQQ